MDDFLPKLAEHYSVKILVTFLWTDNPRSNVVSVLRIDTQIELLLCLSSYLASLDKYVQLFPPVIEAFLQRMIAFMAEIVWFSDNVSYIFLQLRTFCLPHQMLTI